MKEIIDQNLIQDHNLKNSKSLEKDFEFLGEQLQQRGIRIEEIIQKLDDKLKSFIERLEKLSEE